VGVDGTASSRAALRWAAEVARAQHGRLRPVLGWDSPVPAADHRSVRLARNAHERLAAVLREAGDDVRDVDVGPLAVRGEASEVLLAAAAQASLLVLGRAGGADGPVPAGDGVGRRCVERAVCPVVVVPASSAALPPPAACARHAATHHTRETT
jgi:nucleotide-binding universal stress UspA family protein